ncbi:uncharacterized protein MONOS_1748 [Monocercomonoides exilis]|uniref:uncharacterized protein n=1 Tax=Monocercomonoides exilis TaxID=2049356 RepID=UPI00355A5003|nr:hypothetical protein MONOS_1748 [Monocercomonoides exilis]|eukprot:MONOS_1748.1-p1 / transcript=MONOS_1748.1 / gene=MONOS_1748 / organism=Monocercomonoides_exilis_PA203 / gene_product=unspecified product / transcript_product=unspecified product / location=Mono_scaffold00032:129322-130776(-) / protein_length=412 / sequence_SO=supercontig / SO=protein_coding / is_pseudo=false
MSLSNADKCEKGVHAKARTEQFSKLFCELEHCREDEQIQKIKEMNGLIDEMNGKEFESIFTKDLYNKIQQMIEEKTLSWRNATLLLKHVGYCKELKHISFYSFNYSSLSERMRGMIIDENEKKKEKKMKIALKKDETEEAQKEVEMALLALSNIGNWEIEQELYLNEITEIIRYHQEHHNLTRLAYQSAWQFLFYRLIRDKSLEEVIVNELHFGREAARELEDLSKSVDWKRKEERRKETKVKEVSVIKRWLDVIDNYFSSCELWNKELAGLIGSIVQVFLASRDNYKEILNGCFNTLRYAADNRNVKIDAFVKEGIIVLFSEEMNQSTLDDENMLNCLYFFLNISERLKEKKDEETDETKRKELKKKIFEKMEEEGLEDIIASLYGFISFVNKNGYRDISKNTSDYFVND